MPTGIYQHKPCSKKTKIRIGKANSGSKNGMFQKTPWNKGKKTGLIPKKAFPKGYIPWNKGILINRVRFPNMGHFKPHTEEAKKKSSLSHRGEKNYNWKGGTRLESYSEDWNNTLKESIRQRDNYICQLCGIHQDELSGWNKLLDVHHIDYNKKNNNPSNLITLCRSCHVKTNYNRNYWFNLWIK